MIKIFEALERADKEERKSTGALAEDLEETKQKVGTSPRLSTYEDLEEASRERRSSVKVPEIIFPHGASSRTSLFDMEEDMLSLYKSIESMLASFPTKTIQFIGSRKGEGTSTIIRQFALVSAARIGKSVLLLDADRFQPTQHHYFHLSSEHGWQDAVKNYELISEVLHKIGEYSLFVSPSANNSAPSPEIFNTLRLNDFWKIVEKNFELILIDSPPLTVSPDGLAIATKVDGVVLVLEAEKTQWTVAESVIERIGKVGGKILGIVFNKRRYHIPRFIYNIL